MLNLWAPSDVANWISELNFPQYAPLFQTNHITGAILSGLTEGNLEKMGILPIGHQKTILEAISQLFYTVDFPVLTPERHPSTTFLYNTSFPALNSLTSSPSTPILRSPSATSISPPLSRSASLAQDSRHISISLIVFHQRVNSINATYRVGILIEVDPLEPFLLTDGRTSSSSSYDSEGSNGSTGAQVVRGAPPHPDLEVIKEYVDRVVYHWPGESDFGQLVTRPPFEGHTTKDLRANSELIVEIFFSKSKFRKKTASVRHRITPADGFTRLPVLLHAKPFGGKNSQAD